MPLLPSLCVCENSNLLRERFRKLHIGERVGRTRPLADTAFLIFRNFGKIVSWRPFMVIGFPTRNTGSPTALNAMKQHIDVDESHPLLTKLFSISWEFRYHFLLLSGNPESATDNSTRVRDESNAVLRGCYFALFSCHTWPIEQSTLPSLIILWFLIFSISGVQTLTPWHQSAIRVW